MCIIQLMWRKRHTWPEFEPEEIRKRARILVIDDEDFYYLQLFERDGYTIEKWDDVEDLSRLETGYYDVLLLDIQGVGRSLSGEEGLGVLRHIRKTAPAQIVIAYSNANFSLKYQDFWQLADRTLAKTADYMDFKRTVDELLRERFSLEFYVNRIQEVAGAYMLDSARLKQLSQRAILTGNPSKLRQHLETRVDSGQVVNMVLQIAQVAIAIASLASYA